MIAIGSDHAGFEAKKNRTWNDRQNVEIWRQQWAAAQNRELERKGLHIRVNHESYERQGLDREATVHLGHEAAAMERRGLRTERGDHNRAVAARNMEREQGVRKMAEKEPNQQQKVKYDFRHDTAQPREHAKKADGDIGHTIQEQWRHWLGDTGRVGRGIESDKYKPIDGKGQTLQEQLLKWVDDLQRDGKDKDRTR